MLVPAVKPPKFFLLNPRNVLTSALLTLTFRMEQTAISATKTARPAKAPSQTAQPVSKTLSLSWTTLAKQPVKTTSLLTVGSSARNVTTHVLPAPFPPRTVEPAKTAFTRKTATVLPLVARATSSIQKQLINAFSMTATLAMRRMLTMSAR